MAGARDRSRHRGSDRQDQYELQDVQTAHRGRTRVGSTAHSEDLYDDRHHGHPQNSKTLRLDQRILRTCKERLSGALGMCRARSAGVLRICIEWLAKHWMMTLFVTSIICILIILAFCGLNPRATPLDYGLASSTGGPEHDHSTVPVTGGSTVYHIISVQHKQFYGARPVHHQEPMAVPSFPEPKGQVEHQELSHHYVDSTTSASVSGLYFMPMSVTVRDWPQTQQEFNPSSSSAGNTQASQSVQGTPGLRSSEPEVKVLLRSREIRTPSDAFVGKADTDTFSFTRWGVEVLYELRRHTRRSLHHDKEWCIKTACSPHKQLSSMCNTTKTILDPSQKQECKWCFPESRRQQQMIERHCTEVSKRALNATFVICGILLFCTLVIAVALATRMLRHRRRAKAIRVLHKHATTAPEPQKNTNGISSSHFLQGVWKFGRSSKAANRRSDGKANGSRSPEEAVGLNFWHKSVFAKSEKRPEMDAENPASSRSKVQKQQKPKSYGHKIAIGFSDSHGRVPVLPPAPPAISSRVSTNTENMGQGSLTDAGTDSDRHDAQGMPRRSSRQSRAVSSGSEPYPSEATHRGDAAASVYNLQRLTERN